MSLRLLREDVGLLLPVAQPVLWSQLAYWSGRAVQGLPFERSARFWPGQRSLPGRDHALRSARDHRVGGEHLHRGAASEPERNSDSKVEVGAEGALTIDPPASSARGVSVVDRSPLEAGSLARNSNV